MEIEVCFWYFANSFIISQYTVQLMCASFEKSYMWLGKLIKSESLKTFVEKLNTVLRNCKLQQGDYKLI